MLYYFLFCNWTSPLLWISLLYVFINICIEYALQILLFLACLVLDMTFIALGLFFLTSFWTIVASRRREDTDVAYRHRFFSFVCFAIMIITSVFVVAVAAVIVGV